MTLVLINRPNRKNRRHFRACDAARIAREVVIDDLNTTPEEVLACIAKGMGFTHISLSRIRVVESAINLDKRVLVKTLISLVKLMEKASTKFKLLRDFLAPLLVILKKALEMANKIETLDPPQATVEDALNPDKCKCKPTVFKHVENDARSYPEPGKRTQKTG